MKKIVKDPGVFDPQFAELVKNRWELGKYKSIAELKQNLLERLDASTANAINRYKIGTAIRGIKNYSDAMFIVYNHILAHPSEGLKSPAK